MVNTDHFTMGKKKTIQNVTTKNQAKISNFFKKKSEMPLFAVIGEDTSNGKNSTVNGNGMSENTKSPDIKEVSGEDDSDIEIIEATPEQQTSKSKFKGSRKYKFNPNFSLPSNGVASALKKEMKPPKSSMEQEVLKENVNKIKRVATWGTGMSPDFKRSSNGINSTVTNGHQLDDHASPSLNIMDCSQSLLFSCTSNNDSVSQTITTELSPKPNNNAPCNKFASNESSSHVSRQLFDETNISTNALFKAESMLTPQKKKYVQENSDMLDDSFEELLLENMQQMSPFKSSKVETNSIVVQKELEEGLCPTSYAITHEFNRHIVISVQQNVFQREIFLHIKAIENGMPYTCSLTGFWYESIVREDDIVHILFVSAENGHYVISNGKGLIVINPDRLVSGTSVVSGVFCRRKAILNERFKGLDGTNKVMVIGSLVHQLFQEVVKEKGLTKNRLNEVVQELVSQRHVLLDLYGLNMTQSDIMKEVSTFVSFIHNWSNVYLSDSKSSKSKQWPGKILSIEDIEENIWSPRFGVKGKIDLTVKTSKNGISKIMPLELKTGKSTFSAEHKGQVTLYSMMTSDRREDPLSGLLLYLRDGSMHEIPAGEKEKKGLIQLRNEVVSYLYQKLTKENDGSYALPSLPETLDNYRICSKCPQVLTCTLDMKVRNQPVPDEHAMVKLIPETISHLNQDHLDYFRKWCLMLHLEQSADLNNNGNKGLWCMTAEKREEAGDCISNLLLNEKEKVYSVSTTGFVHHFSRDSTIPRALPTDNFNVGDYVVVSSVKEIAISSGTIQRIDTTSLSIILDRNLQSLTHWRRRKYRVDRTMFASTMGMIYSNLASLMLNNERSEKLRNLIIDKVEPTFTAGFKKDKLPLIKPLLKAMNNHQQRAILRCLLSKDYVILKGFPGTGKTSTIVSLVRILVLLGHSVLVTSYTHSAVDNILLKLKNYDDTNILRLGKMTRIHEDLRLFSEDQLLRHCRSVEEICACFESKNVVATTCLGMNHVIFTKRKFDFCIIDEASQVLQTAALAPLFHCDRFVLVGDSLQLPPIVKSNQAKSLGMMESLFERLDMPSSSVSLKKQYRMNGEIMDIANKLVYNNQLECATETLTTKTLQCQINPVVKWLEKIVSITLEDSVVFIDTSGYALEEKNKLGHPINRSEKLLVLAITKKFLEFGVSADEIGIITPYRGQVQLLKEALFDLQVEINTVDQYQGRDKEVIVYSAVRSNRSLEVKETEILQDLRRLNVATTRAKSKLIIIGDRTSLKLYDPFKQLFTILRPDQLYSLVPGKDGYNP